MVKVSVFVGASVDGFIARGDDRLDFLDSAGPTDSDMGFGALLASVDVMIMGRRTFEVVRGFVVDDGADWPYGDRRVVVASRSGVEVPDQLASTVMVDSSEPSAMMAALAGEGYEHAYVDGAALIQSFLREGLVDEITVTTVPVLIGDGITLFGELPGDVTLRHLESEVFDNGCVQTRYAVVR